MAADQYFRLRLHQPYTLNDYATDTKFAGDFAAYRTADSREQRNETGPVDAR